MLSQSNRSYSLICGAILLLALALRALGVTFGLPYTYHQDEPMMVHHALAMGTGDLNPHYFVIPAFVMYALLLLFGLSYAWGHVWGHFESTRDFAFQFLDNPAWFYLSGRLVIGAALGVATVYTVMRMRKFFDSRVVIFAGVFLAVAFLHVKNSRYIYADIPMTFFIMLFFYAAFCLIRKSDQRHTILTGICLGFAAASKYHAGLVALPMAFIYLVWGGREVSIGKRLYLLVGLGLTSVVTFLAINPFIALDFGSFASTWQEQIHAQTFVGWFHHLGYSLAQGLGWPLLILGAYGFTCMARQHPREGYMLILFAVLYYCVCVYLGQPYSRYMVPLVPIICLAAGFGMAYLLKILSRLSQASLFQKMAQAGLVVLVIAWPLGMSIYSGWLLQKKDTRTLSKEWVETHIATGSRIALSHTFFAPRLWPTLDTIDADRIRPKERVDSEKLRRELLKQVVQDKAAYRMFYVDATNQRIVYTFSKPLVKATWSALQNAGIDYVVVSFQDMSPPLSKFQQMLETKSKRVASFSPYRDPEKKIPEDPSALTADPLMLPELLSRKRMGPYLEIYEIS